MKVAPRNVRDAVVRRRVHRHPLQALLDGADAIVPAVSRVMRRSLRELNTFTSRWKNDKNAVVPFDVIGITLSRRSRACRPERIRGQIREGCS